MTRAEHVAWCKQRALTYLELDPPRPLEAFNSMVSDMRKHKETAGEVLKTLGAAFLMSGRLQDPAAVRAWVEGWN